MKNIIEKIEDVFDKFLGLVYICFKISSCISKYLKYKDDISLNEICDFIVNYFLYYRKIQQCPKPMSVNCSENKKRNDI